MGRYTGPKTKVSRRYGVPLFGPSKSLERKNYPPGMHGPKGSRRKQSDYAIALGEKQTEDATTGAAQSGTDPNRSGSRLADGRSRCSQRQSSPHSVAGRDSTNGQRAVDRRVVFAVTVAALCQPQLPN